MPIGSQPPVTNKAAADKNKAATAIHMQDQFKAGAAPKDTSTISKLGAAFTGEQRQQDVAVAGAEAGRDIAGIEREQQTGELEQAGQNIKDQEQLSNSIQEQKTKLIDMNIGITEDEFADTMTIRQLNEGQTFQNETQLNDLAMLSFQNEEEYADMLQDSYQRTLQQQKDDEWELSVYTRAADDEAMSKKIAKDTAKRAQILEAQRDAARKAKAAQAKAGKTQKMIGAVKIVAGAALIATGAGAPVGVGLMASGAGDAATADQQ